MITKDEAERIAAGWARTETTRRGYSCEPEMTEFDHGFVVWTRQPPDVLPVPGDGARTVIDKESGLLSTWPAIGPEEIAAYYAARRPQPPGTVDPAVALLRATHRSPVPAIVAHLFADGRLFRAQGAKGDQAIDHHPLVAAALAGVDPAARVRGAERHAELIALSDALRTAGPLTLSDARSWLEKAQFQAYHVRHQGDPLAGRTARPCETCLRLLVEFALLPWSAIAHADEWHSASDRIPTPGRFPYDVARILAAGGWPAPSVGGLLGAEAIARAAKAGGGHLPPPFPAAIRAINDFPAVYCARRGPGLRRAIRILSLDPVPVARTAASLAEFGEVLGVRLFPIGAEGGDAVVAIDDRGRVFILDQTGEWFVGATLDEALAGLLTGAGPAERVRDDGTW